MNHVLIHRELPLNCRELVLNWSELPLNYRELCRDSLRISLILQESRLIPGESVLILQESDRESSPDPERSHSIIRIFAEICSVFPDFLSSGGVQVRDGL